MSINTNQAISFFAWASFRGELSLSDLHADNAKSVLNEHATVRLSDKKHFNFFHVKKSGFHFFSVVFFFSPHEALFSAIFRAQDWPAQLRVHEARCRDQRNFLLHLYGNGEKKY